MDSNSERTVGRGGVVAVALLVAGALLAAPVAAQPSIAITDTSLERPVTTVGEPVNATVGLWNSGSSGATTLNVEVDGVSHAERRAVVRSEENRKVGIPLTFDETGTYDVTVNGREAGTVTVVRARTGTVRDRGNGRTVSVVGSTDGTETTVSTAVPAAANQSVYLDRITLRSSESQFNAGFESYVPASVAPIIVPEGQGAKVLGALRTGGQLGVETASFRLVVSRDVLLERDIGTRDFTIYQQEGTQYVPLETELVNQSGGAYVYEATVDGGTRFVFGHLEPRFETRNTVLDTNSVDRGVRVSVTATIANEGGVPADYTGDLRVDGTVVGERNVTVPAGGTGTMTLEHVITAPGSHEVALGDQVVGSVEVSPAGNEVGGDGDSGPSGGVGGGALAPGLIGSLGLGGFGPSSIAVGASVAIFGGVLALALRE